MQAIQVSQDGGQQHILPASRCSCGSRSTDRHKIYIACLEYDKTQKPATGQNAGAGWYNWLSYVLAGHPVIHVQVVFVGDGYYYTYSADKSNGVSGFTTRQFSGKWRFFEMHVSEHQELAMRNFFVSQLNKPFSFWGTFWLYTLIPRQSTGYEWFCSELVVTAMQHAGFLRSWKNAWTVKPHNLFVHLSTEFVEAPCFLMSCNPVAFDIAVRNGTLSFNFGMQGSGVEQV
jgi:hypothetical protein